MTRLFALLLLATAVPAAAQVRYVDGSATSNGSGTSWADPYRDLRDALAVVSSGQIWVAEGTYTPSASGDRDASFRVAGGVRVYGGFPAGGAPFDARDPDLYPTFLSGDLAGDDGPGFINRADNSYHVLNLSPGVSDDPVTPATLIEGVTVTGGEAQTATASYLSGGGLLCGSQGSSRVCAPTLRDVRFVQNSGAEGGAVAVLRIGSFALPDDIEPRFESVTFEGNRAVGSSFDGNGGAVLIDGYAATFVGGAFEGNQADSEGGAVFIDFEYGFRDTLFDGVAFRQNTAGTQGGAVSVDGFASPVFRHATFTENIANRGGALAVGGYSGSSAATCQDCTFTANTAVSGGGGVAALADNGGNVTVTLVDARFFGNVGGFGGAVFAEGTDFGDAVVTLDNAVLSGNRTSAGGGAGGGALRLQDDGEGTARAEVAQASVARNGATGPFVSVDLGGASAALLRNVAVSEAGASVEGDVTFEYAVIGGGCPAGATCTAVTDADPLFADADGADGVPGTLDDDLRPQPGSPAVDAGSVALIPPDRLDLDGDGETDDPLPFDLAGLPRTIGGAPDAGAFEFSADAFVQVETLDRPVIGSGGGALPVRLRVGNTSGVPITASLHVEFVFADGSVLQAQAPETITVGPGDTFGPVERVLQVPAGAPVGPAAVRVRLGDGLALASAPFEVSSMARLVVTVTTRTDEYGDIPGGADTGCALREAIEAVNRNEDFDDCVLQGAGAPALVQLAAGLYRLTRDDGYVNDAIDGDLPVARSIEIRGAGQFTTTILADFDDISSGLFDVRPEAGAFALGSLTLTGGAASLGGAVYAPGVDLTLDDVGVLANFGGNGGGVYHTGGALVVRDSYVSGNEAAGGAPVFDDEQARDGGRGAGIATVDAASVVIENTVFEDNTAGAGGAVGDDDGAAGDGGNGGGLYVARAAGLSITGSRFIGNRAGAGGGASDGSTGTGGKGGGLYVRQVPTVLVGATRFEDNQAGPGGVAAKSDVDSFGGRGGDGGGLAFELVSGVQLVEVAFAGNTAGTGGDGFDEGAGRGGRGGGLYATGSAVTLERSLVANNTAGAGGDVSDGDQTEPPGDGGAGGGLFLSASATLTVHASTFSGNAAGAGGVSDTGAVGDPGVGGGAALDGSAEIENATVTQNDAGAGGGLWTSDTSPLTLTTSLVAGNRARGDALAPTADCDGEVTDDGFNVVGAGTGCPASGTATVAVAPDAVFTTILNPDLTDNGGPTLTHALATGGNPAVDIGGTCGPLDQRGSAAPTDDDGDGAAACDAGAVEGADFVVDVEDTDRLAFGLGAVSPNPARGTAVLPFTLAAGGPVHLDVFDVRGRRVVRVLDAERPAGRHVVALDASRLAAGVYVVRLLSGEEAAVRRLTVVR